MTVEIGSRKLDSLTEAELGEFLYNHGYCGSVEFWEPPVFTEFDLFRGSIHFSFEQSGKSGQTHKVKRDGIISEFNDHAHFSYFRHGNVESHYFKTIDIAYFLSLGFNIPLIYNGPPKFQTYER